MEIEAVKTWQWMLAGLVVGFLFSAIIAWSGPTFDTQARDTMEQGEFENGAIALTRFGQTGVLARQYHQDQPLLRDVTVHPPLASDPDRCYWVTGRAYYIGLKPADPTKVTGPEKVYEEWRPFKYPASVPYAPGFTLREEKKLSKTATPGQRARNQQLADLKKQLGGQATFATINDYLKAVGGLPGAMFKYQYAWWELPIPKWTLPPTAGLLVFGVAWPLTLGMLQNLGVAKPAPRKAAIPASIAATAPRPVRPELPPMAVAPVVAKLPKPADTKKYGGEFYPVVKTTSKE